MKFLDNYGIDAWGKVRKNHDGYVEIHRKGNDTICFQAHEKTTTHVVPKIYVYYYAETNRHAVKYDSFRSMNDSLGTTLNIDYIILNDELTKQALSNGAMRAIYNEKNNYFNVREQKNLMLLNDVVSWLTSVLGETTITRHSSTSSNGCYIATAVYGSYDCPEVWTLRRFRDYDLRKKWYGRLFIRVYYTISPTLVRVFGKNRMFISFWRKKLDRLIFKLQKRGYESTAYKDD